MYESYHRVGSRLGKDCRFEGSRLENILFVVNNQLKIKKWKEQKLF